MTRAGLLAILLLLLAPHFAYGNAGPQPPITREEVKNPQDWLRMEREVVDVTVDGARAHVVARFHFLPAKRNDWTVLTLRMGFPELTADAPLENFKAHWVVRSNAPQSDEEKTPDVIVTQAPVSDAWSSSLGVKRWFTWPVELFPAKRYTSPQAVDLEVSYDQALRKGPQGSWQTTYVLRTGAPWSGNIASSVVNLHLGPNVKLVKATPPNYKLNGAEATFAFTDWKPNTDVTFWVRK